MKSELPKKPLLSPSTVRIPQIPTKAPNTASNTTSTLELNAPEPPCCIGGDNPPLEPGPGGGKLVSESCPDSEFSAGCELLTAAYGVEVTTGISLRSIGDLEGAISWLFCRGGTAVGLGSDNGAAGGAPGLSVIGDLGGAIS